MNKQRMEAEKLVYEVMDIMDPSGANKEYWMNEFVNLSDEQFKHYISRPMWAFFQVGAFKKETSMNKIRKALKRLNVPLLEQVYLPYKYKDKDGKPMRTKECLVLYLNDKRMKQMLTKKNHVSMDFSVRDMKTGQLTGPSKAGRVSDHEFESFSISGLENSKKEMGRARADSLQDKEIMNNQIKTLGQVYLKDLPALKSDSISKNNLSSMFLGGQLITNLVIQNYMTPYTLKDKERRVSRVD